ncbi:hypothetical protein [Cellulosilyticum lentocellum]|nr:hypothetical protein [Cellulosilyticum lentocellum]
MYQKFGIGIPLNNQEEEMKNMSHEERSEKRQDASRTALDAF